MKPGGQPQGGRGARRSLGEADLPPAAAVRADHRLPDAAAGDPDRRRRSRRRPARLPAGQRFLDFMLAGAMIQSTMLAGNSGGIALAVDIEMGFTDRLLAAPISRYAIVLGRLAGTAALGAFSAIWFLAIGLIFGAQIDEGVPGALLMILFVTLSAIAFGGIGAAVALRTGSASVVQGLFPLVFVVLFLSSAFFPGQPDARAGGDDRQVQPAQLHRRRGPRPGDLVAVPRGVRQGDRLDRADRRDQRGPQRPARCRQRLQVGGLSPVGWRADLDDDRGADAAGRERAAAGAGRGDPRGARADDLLPRPQLGVRAPHPAAGLRHERATRAS